MNSIKKTLFISATSLSILFSGCATVKPKIVYNPQLQHTATAEVGQNIFSKVYAVYDYDYQVKFEDNQLAQNEGINLGILKDMYLEIDENNNCYLTERLGRSYEAEDYGCKGEFTVVNHDEVTTPLKYTRIPAKPTQVQQDAFKYEVLYQGKVANKLNITFQEFVSSPSGFMIRNAYTQNIQYELDENGQAIIGFKGLRIKVLKATNFDITYQVLSDYK